MSVTETGPRAREPDQSGYALASDGLRLYWELFGSLGPTVVLLPANPISHSRLWKAQIHYLARSHRVLAYDGRGNGNSDIPDTSGPFLDEWRPADCLAVMDATGTERAVLVGLCVDGVWPAVQLAASHPERVQGIVAIAPGIPLLTPPQEFKRRALETFDQEITDPVGWEKLNRHYIRREPRGFLEFFFGEMFPEPHSTKQIEDAVAYGLDGSLDVLLMEDGELVGHDRDGIEAICRQVRCPLLVVQGSRDNCQPPERGRRLAALAGGEHVELIGAGHIPGARHPVAVNHLIAGFIAAAGDRSPDRRERVRGRARTQRALLVSSPIGLGHAWRDVAIARQLRALAPALGVHWLAQPPVSTLLESCGETIHPASAELASEAAGVDAQAGEHELHAFQMLRRLDEIFCANFMVFSDLVREEAFDVWIADEAWEVDYFLHENPELKSAPYVWLTDFVGVLPMPGGGGYERFLAADHNAQMVEHIAERPQLRDASIFIGDPEDIVDERLGPDLPEIREWTEQHFRFSGYITGFHPSEIADRERLRAELGYGPDEKICIVAAGGSAVGTQLLRLAAAAFPAAKRRLPELRMLLIAGPRVDPRSLPDEQGLEIHGYVHRLYRQLAACDIAISHGGLSTTMELTAAGRPFLYFPLRDHFEQNIHVDHRLRRHRAGQRMSFEASTPESVAAAIAEELERPIDYLRVPDDGASRAATIISRLLR